MDKWRLKKSETQDIMSKSKWRKILSFCLRMRAFLTNLSYVMMGVSGMRKEKKMVFLEYPRCTTCQKAKKWLDQHNVIYDDRHIVDNNPSYDELKDWYERSGLPLKKFFNTSGLLYKEMQLKDKLPDMSEQEQLELLATNGMLVKRPLIIEDNMVLVGFKEAEWAEKLDESIL